MRLNLLVYLEGEQKPVQPQCLLLRNIEKKTHVIIVGTGPAGLFATLRLIELGFKPVLLECGKEVSERKKDIARIHREYILITESNYCFGEGGAGTFSDDKLYTRSKKKGENQKVFEILNLFGAPDDILYESHPHVGSDILPGIIKKIRNTIVECGGEFHFEEKVIDLVIRNNKVKGVVTGKHSYDTKAIILATGHSARDIYTLLDKYHLKLECKGFAVGVRIEHPQDIIDEIQYHKNPQIQYLPPASYSLSTQVNNRGVYSFCMCPGGYIVPSATGEKEIVVNGMSPMKRNTPFANSGMVVEIQPGDIKGYENEGAMALLRFQQQLESLAHLNGGSGQTAPTQRINDFIKNKLSSNLPPHSYIPDLISSPVHFWLPGQISYSLHQAFKSYGKRMKGFLTNEAIVVGVESRTSSPIRILRNSNNLQHPQIEGLFPAGEGAGYAGGIVSSAIDGMLCVEQAYRLL